MREQAFRICGLGRLDDGRRFSQLFNAVGYSFAFPESNDADFSFEQIDVQFQKHISSDFLFYEMSLDLTSDSF